MKEEWKVIPSFPRYQVSSEGRIRSIDRGPMRVRVKPHGYCYVLLAVGNSKKVRKYIHHLVLEAFVGPRPKGYQCDHINAVRDDNRLENLHWVTPSENQLNPIRRSRAHESLFGRKLPRKTVYCVETGEVLGDPADTAALLGVSGALVTYACRTGAGIKRCGGLHFAYRSRVVCLETGEEFSSITEAARAVGSSITCVGKVCRGKSKTANGFHFKFI